MKLSDLNTQYDLVIAGGGITGAGIFHEAVQKGYKTLLLESNDFAWGTSSRSSKMVHGGLRYLKQGRFLMTRASVKQREYLLNLYPGLISPLKYMLPLYDNYGPKQSAMKLGLSIYSFMAQKKQHQMFSKSECIKKLPPIRQENLLSACGFTDAQVDDARLVLRLIFDACGLGGDAINYIKLDSVQRENSGKVSSVQVIDQKSGQVKIIKTKAVVNATGVFVDQLSVCPIKGHRIRPLRGSHLIFPGHLIELNHVISFFHPEDLRPVFLFPWEGCLILGTTDLDHDQDLSKEPRMTPSESEYLLSGLKYILPDLNIELSDCIASIAGVRPVLSKVSNKRSKFASKKIKAASKESREHVVWKDGGVVSVTGGKLTTFRLLAQDALKAAADDLPAPKPLKPELGTIDSSSHKQFLLISNNLGQRVIDRLGIDKLEVFKHYDKNLFNQVPGTTTLWAELYYSAAHEQVRHLDDLLLRRTRIGLFLPQGGVTLLDEIESVCTPCLPWNKERWKQEKKNYLDTWNQYYSPPTLKEEA